MQLKPALIFLLLSSPMFAQIPLRSDPKDIIATVGERDITREELQRIMYVAGPQFTGTFQANPQVALFQWFVQQHLGKEGADMKLDQQSPLKEQIEAMRMSYLADARINLEMNGYRPPQADIEKYYAQNANRFQRVKVSGILVKFKPKDSGGTSTEDLKNLAMQALMGLSERSEEAALGIANDVAKRLRAGEDMATLVAQYSEDAASKARGGDFGFITSSSEFPPEFNTGALTLATGNVSNPIRVPTGFYVLRAEERSAVPLRDASPDIETELRKAHLDDFMKALNNQYRVTIKDPSIVVAPTQR